ncbi:MAG: hypothetical protein ACK5RO_00580 [Pseudobdellovibrionaceae bacterium]|jgi:hypothetical protein
MAKWTQSKSKSLHQQLLAAEAKSKSASTKFWLQTTFNIFLLVAVGYAILKGF